MTITAEQVARAIEAAKTGDPFALWDALPTPGEGRALPDYVYKAIALNATATVAALTRWHAELVAAETPRKAPDDTAPERLRERREALGWNQTWAAEDINRLHGFTEDPWGWRCVASCEDGSASAIDRARYAAALSAAEAERAAKPAIDPLAYTDSPAWDEPPVRKPAPEVVDVPQPIRKRCACPDIHDDVEATWQSGEPYLTVTHTTVPLALLRAMIEAIDAQQGGVR